MKGNKMNLLNELLADLRATNNTTVGENATSARTCVMTLKAPSVIESIAKTYGYSAKVVKTYAKKDGNLHCIDVRKSI